MDERAKYSFTISALTFISSALGFLADMLRRQYVLGAINLAIAAFSAFLAVRVWVEKGGKNANVDVIEEK